MISFVLTFCLQFLLSTILHANKCNIRLQFIIELETEDQVILLLLEAKECSSSIVQHSLLLKASAAMNGLQCDTEIDKCKFAKSVNSTYSFTSEKQLLELFRI